MYSRKSGYYNDTVEIATMKKSYLINLKFTFLPRALPDIMSKKSKKSFFSIFFLPFLNFQILPNLELLTPKFFSMDLILKESITRTWYMKV